MHRLAPLGPDDPDSENALRVTQSVAIARQMPMVLLGNGLTSIIGSMALSITYTAAERLPLVVGMWILLLPVVLSWWRLRRRAVPARVSRQRIVKLTIYSGLIGWFWTACMLWYLPEMPPEVFAFLITGCGFLAAGSATILYMVPVACLLYSLPMMVAAMYLTARSGLPSATSLTLGTGMMTAAIGWMLFANWKNFRTLFMLSREREIRSRRDAKATLERSEYLENFSHEIRNPLTSIIGFANLLDSADHAIAPELKRYVRNIITAGDAMRILLNDLLDIARLDVDHLKIQATPFQLRVMLDNAISLITFSADKKKLPIRFHVDPGVPDWLYADSYRLRQVILNLLSNAIKFTVQGHIEIVVSWDAGSVNDGVLRVRIADTGPGMPHLDENHRFERFSRLAPAAAGNPDGAGLGLFISQQLILKMGGEMKFKTEHGYGAVFVVTLALKTLVAPAPVVVSGPAAPLPATDRLRILISDDMPLNRELIRRILETAGHTVADVSDGTQAVDQCRLQKFDLIFMDIEMPGVDGVMATRMLRQQCPRNRLTPVIAVTGHVGFNQLAEFGEAGIDDCLPKPLSQGVLLDMVSRWKHEKSQGSALVD